MFKIGDRVSLKKLTSFEVHIIKLKVGDTGIIVEPTVVQKEEFIRRADLDVSVQLDKKLGNYDYEGNNSRLFFSKNLELVTPKIKRSRTRKPLQVGDNVIVVRLADEDKNQSDLSKLYGRIGTITSVYPSGLSIDVEFPGWSGGWGLGQRNKWCIDPENLVRIRMAKK